MKKSIATLEYKDKEYVISLDFQDSYPNHTIDYMWTEGNYECDCNKSLFIKQQLDKNFPEFDCGETIKLKKLEIKEHHAE